MGTTTTENTSIATIIIISKRENLFGIQFINSTGKYMKWMFISTWFENEETSSFATVVPSSVIKGHSNIFF